MQARWLSRGNGADSAGSSACWAERDSPSAARLFELDVVEGDPGGPEASRTAKGAHVEAFALAGDQVFETGRHRARLRGHGGQHQDERHRQPDQGGSRNAHGERADAGRSGPGPA